MLLAEKEMKLVQRPGKNTEISCLKDLVHEKFGFWGAWPHIVDLVNARPKPRATVLLFKLTLYESHKKPKF